MKNDWVQLVDYRRNGIPEVTLHGAISWVHGRKLIHSYGGNVVCYGRSLLKPILFKPLAHSLSDVLDRGQQAIAVSSHNSEPIHIKTAKSILKPSEASLMKTPHALPMMQFGKQLRRPRRWYHPCSGKHAAILRACKQLGWKRVGYFLPQHQVHQSFLSWTKDHINEELTSRQTAKDGCGLPTVAMTVNEMAGLFAGLATTRDEDWIWTAMTEEPDLVGGFNRLDSTILKSCHKQVLAKEGADGLLGLSIVHPDYPEGLGIVIKMAHGWDTQATWYVARLALGVLGFELRNPYKLDRQKAFVVGETVPEELRANISQIKPWDSWDSDRDRWEFDHNRYVKMDENENLQKLYKR